MFGIILVVVVYSVMAIGLYKNGTPVVDIAKVLALFIGVGIGGYYAQI